MSDLDQMSPMEPGMDPQTDISAEPTANAGAETHDQEGKMAKADLYKLATYSHKLFKQLHDDDQLEAWVQAKITKAADYVASVYHYLEYEMKFSEYGQHLDNAETLSESQRAKLKAVLSEAKDKVKELKKSQAKKVEFKKVEENRLQGGEQPCAECGGTGVVHMAPMSVHPDKQHLVDKHRVFRDAVKAISKKGDTELTDEEFDDDERGGDDKTDSKFNVKKTSTGTRYTRKSSTFSDEHDGGDGKKSHAKDKSAGEKKAEKEKDVKLPKHDKPTWGMKGGEKFGKKEKEVEETIGQGVFEAKNKCCCEEKGKAKCPVHSKVEESKPSAGLSKAKKSAVVKKAKAGGDIGKPGKSFDKVAKAAGGGKKGEKIAAAAMWKNIKETTAYLEEKKAVEKLAKQDFDNDGKRETGPEEHAGVVDKAIKASKAKETVKESADTTRIRQLMQRLNG